jgi:uncharacterized protein YndB with AHSA1/START domain
MAQRNDLTTEPGSVETESELSLSRTFDAPRDLVFRAWTEREHLMRWWGPRSFTWITATLDLRPGGAFHYMMLSPEGKPTWGKFVYREIAAPERLVYVSSFADGEGNVIRAPFNAQLPLEILNTVTFVEKNGKTTVTLRGGPINATEAERKVYFASRPHIQRGFAGTFDQLEAQLRASQAGDAVVVKPLALHISRVFNAPREVVYRAFTSPEHLGRWWGPKFFSTPTVEVDLRQGGAFRFVMRGPDGKDYPFSGHYDEVAPLERLVFTGNIHDEANQEVKTTLVFSDHPGGKTLLTLDQAFAVESMATGGAPVGWTQSLDKLAEHLATTK